MFKTLLKQLAFMPGPCKICPRRHVLQQARHLWKTTAKGRLAIRVAVALWFSDCLLQPPFDLWLSFCGHKASAVSNVGRQCENGKDFDCKFDPCLQGVGWVAQLVEQRTENSKKGQ
jgi:hypothetical protein